MSIDTAPDGKLVLEQTTEQGIMDGVAVHTTSRTLIGRDAELTEIASLLGVSVVCGRGRRRAPRSRSTSCCPVTPASARPGCWSSCATSRSRRDGAWSPGTAWTSATARCPTCRSPRCSAGSQAELPEVVQRVAEAHPALARLQPGRRVMVATGGRAAPPAGSRARGSTAPTCSPRCTRCWRRRPRCPRCCWSSRTATGPTSRPATCSASCSPGPSTAPVAIVASYRSDDLHRRHPLRRQVAEWSRLRSVERLQLGPLRRRAGPAAHRQPLAGARSREKELTAIVRRAEGNAFFVEELVGAAVRARQLGTRRPRRRAAGPARPAQRRRPAGGPGGQRRRPQGRARPARRGVRTGGRPSSRRGCGRPSR